MSLPSAQVVPPKDTELMKVEKPAKTADEVHPTDSATDRPIGLYEEDKHDRLDLWNCGNLSIRSIHMAWFSFFVAFSTWFSIAPLMPAIKKSLRLQKKQIAITNLASVLSTMIGRVTFGPLVDAYGPTACICIVLVLGAIPVFCVALVNSFIGLVIIRLAIGLMGASFVMSQAWTTLMFQKKCIGTANAIVGGWGNLGGGVIQEIMVEIYSGFMSMGMTSDQAWRRSFFIPASVAVVIGILVFFFGTDSPKGNYRDLKKRGVVFPKATKSLCDATNQHTTWIMASQYAASFGVEITVFNMAASYFHDDFHVSIVKAGKLASLAGVTNIFARAMGGFFSDCANYFYGTKGRVWCQFSLILLEGAFLLWFAKTDIYGQAVVLMVVFSILVQAANGSCYALVPYINCGMGSASGLVGAGGNVGAIIFSCFFIFGGFAHTAEGFAIMAYCVFASAAAMLFVRKGGFVEPGGKVDPEVERTTHVDEDEHEETKAVNQV